MELKHIKELMSAMGRTGTKRVKLKKNDFELIIEREGEAGFSGQMIPSFEENFKEVQTEGRLDRASLRAPGISRAPSTVAPPLETKMETAGHHYVTSPMVGTFYPSPSPEEPHFIKVGDKVDKNTVVCVIEAMKVMNEIKANLVGTVAEVLIEAGQPVEFGTKLFRIIES